MGEGANGYFLLVFSFFFYIIIRSKLRIHYYPYAPNIYQRRVVYMWYIYHQTTPSSSLCSKVMGDCIKKSSEIPYSLTWDSFIIFLKIVCVEWGVVWVGVVRYWSQVLSYIIIIFLFLHSPYLLASIVMSSLLWKSARSIGIKMIEGFSEGGLWRGCGRNKKKINIHLL